MIHSFNDKYTLEEQVEIIRNIRYKSPNDMDYKLVYYFFYIVGDLLHPVVKDCIMESELDSRIRKIQKDVLAVPHSGDDSRIREIQKEDLRVEVWRDEVDIGTYHGESCPFPEFGFRRDKFLFRSDVLWNLYEPLFRKRGSKEPSKEPYSDIPFNELHILTALVECLWMEEQKQLS